MEATIKKDIRYVSSRVVKTENGYGLFVISDVGKSRVYPDLSSDLGALCAFSDKINQGELSPLHIDDIIEDMLG